MCNAIFACTKSTKQSIEGVPPAAIQFDFILIDKDSNVLFKIPEIFNTKYNPNKIICTDEKNVPLHKNYFSYESNGYFAFCSLDTLKSGQIFFMALTDGYTANTEDSLGRCKYFLSFNQMEYDTFVMNGKMDYCKYNDSEIKTYKGDRFPLFRGKYLIKK